MEDDAISTEVAVRVWMWATDYCYPPITPEPEDRVETTYRIDPDDVEEFVDRCFDEFALEKPERTNPAVLPHNPSLAELAAWLEKERRAQAAHRSASR